VVIYLLGGGLWGAVTFLIMAEEEGRKKPTGKRMMNELVTNAKFDVVNSKRVK
jgi:hypothetical protein